MTVMSATRTSPNMHLGNRIVEVGIAFAVAATKLENSTLTGSNPHPGVAHPRLHQIIHSQRVPNAERACSPGLPADPNVHLGWRGVLPEDEVIGRCGSDLEGATANLQPKALSWL